jgi:DNA-binding response OmpR family regulator
MHLGIPDRDGIELIRSPRGTHKVLPIVAMSGSFAARFMKVPVALGAVGTLQKPFKQEALLAMVVKILGKQRHGPFE